MKDCFIDERLRQETPCRGRRQWTEEYVDEAERNRRLDSVSASVHLRRFRSDHGRIVLQVKC